ncbi:MAG: TonB-dependent receptor [Gammaproteobacteria bacterium]|nr:TonB-dependent receptor [Gammaproteobacteria bacterium]
MKVPSMTIHALCICAAVGLSTAALAQSSPPANDQAAAAAQGSGDGGSYLEEVMVTARKRNESILKVPVVVTAIADTQLEQFAIHDLFTVATRVPGLLVGTSLAANGLQVSMRGIGTTANNATVDNSISLNIDGLQLSQGLSYGIGMFDVAQVEVLKGPQALFYGKNSPAGVISLRSADPTDKLELTGRVGYEAEAHEKTGEFVISGAASRSVKLRLAAKYSDQDGFFRNSAVAIANRGAIDPTDRHVNGGTDLMLRGTALFDPADWYSARLKASYENSDVDTAWPALQASYCPEGTGAVAPVNIQFMNSDCTLDRYVNATWPSPTVFTNLRNGGRPFNKTKQGLYSLEQVFKLGRGFSLNSLTGLYDLKQEYLFLAGFSAVVPLISDSDFLTHQVTQELRLTSDFNTPVNFMLGAYYQDADQQTHVRLYGNTAVGLPATSQLNDHRIDIESLSFFGQITWKINAQLEFAPGARWTHETRVHHQWNYLVSNGPVGQSVLLDPRVSSSNISPEATLTYTPTDDLTLFGSYKTGFKSGSFNATIFSNTTTPASFADEKVRGGEVGLKGRFLDRRLSFNAAIYDYRYSDLQVGAGEIRGSVIINRTLNAAEANVRGIDLDVTYAPQSVPQMRVQAALNYNHARYGSFPNAPCGNGQTIGQGCNQLQNPATLRYSAQDLAGRELVRAPTWMGTLGVDHEQPIGDSLALHLGAFATYSSEYSQNLTDLPGFVQPAYTKLDASVALRRKDDKWDVSLIGTNLANKITSGNCFNSNLQNGSFFGGQIQGAAQPGAAGGDEANCVAERGREIWLRASMRMGN